MNFAIQRNNALYALFNGGGLSSDLCDADTYLLRAAKHHGELRIQRKQAEDHDGEVEDVPAVAPEGPEPDFGL